MEMKEQKSSRQAAGRQIILLGLKTGLLLLLSLVLLRIVFGAVQIRDQAMFPSLREGDLILYYRIRPDPVRNDVIAVQTAEGIQIRRVIAAEGDTVGISEDGLSVNGYLQQESGIQGRTQPYQEGITFPVTLKQGQVFVLADDREQAEDSRIYGPVNRSAILGKAIFIIRRRNL